MRYTITSPVLYSEEIKKSKFIVHAAPILSEEEATRFIAQVKDPTATHNCFAWKLGQAYRFSDDGEPTSTAGRPILSAIEGQHCDQVVIVVIRYFGGIKLGTGGLIRAYGGSASHCLQQKATLIPLIARKTYRLQCSYTEWPILENQLDQLQALQDQVDYVAEGVKLQLQLTEEMVELLAPFLQNLTKGREQLHPID